MQSAATSADRQNRLMLVRFPASPLTTAKTKQKLSEHVPTTRCKQPQTNSELQKTGGGGNRAAWRIQINH